MQDGRLGRADLQFSMVTICNDEHIRSVNQMEAANALLLWPGLQCMYRSRKIASEVFAKIAEDALKFCNLMAHVCSCSVDRKGFVQR
jgi:hypothetical protein